MLTAFVSQERGDWDNYVCPAQKHGLVGVCALTEPVTASFSMASTQGDLALCPLVGLSSAFSVCPVLRTNKLACFDTCHVN